MRLLLSLSLCALACQAQRPEDPVLAVYRQMEKFEQTGDGNAWIELWSPSSRIRSSGIMKDMIRPQPSVRYQAIKVLVEGDRAAIIGRTADQHLSLRFVRENNDWKILDELWSNVPIDPASIYALVPPGDGAFARAGLPWADVPPAAMNPRYFDREKPRWNLRAAHDESFLYVRIEASSVFPLPNSEVQGTGANLKSGAPHDWPVMKIRVQGAPPREYTFSASDFVGDQATFDQQGKANSHRYFVAYTLSLRKGQTMIFSAGAGATTDPLISVKENFIDLRIPLKSLGIETRAPAIELADANAPLGMILPYSVKPFASR